MIKGEIMQLIIVLNYITFSRFQEKIDEQIKGTVEFKSGDT